MKFRRQVWAIGGNRCVVTATDKNLLDLPGQMVDYVQIVTPTTPGETDRVAQFRDECVVVDCLNVFGASCSAFGEMLGYVDEVSMTAIDDAVTEIGKKHQDIEQQRHEESEAIRIQIWDTNPELARIIQHLNEAWNTDFISVVLDPRGVIPEREDVVGRMCISYTSS